MEAFALATDRAKFLETLIPGTDDYYHYHALHALHEGRLEDVKELSKRWYDKHRGTPRYYQIQHRLALCSESEESYDYLKNHLGLHFNHQREVEDRVTDYPTALDPERVGREGFKRRAYADYSGLGGFADPALEWLLEEGLTGRKRRELLDRITVPDHPSLISQLVADMIDDDKDNPQYGIRDVHRRLTREQLEQLAYQVTGLNKQTSYVTAYLERLRPGPQVDLETDLEERRAYLERVWAFVKPLPPAFHDHKLHTLYSWLELERRQGIYDRARFMEYIQLPRQASYVEPDFLELDANKYHIVSLGSHAGCPPGLTPMPADDEPLVRSFLEHFFAEAENWKPYDTFIRDSYLKRLFATTKILLGQGDGERWYSLLKDPGYYQQLKDQVGIEFAIENPEWFAADAEVSLDVYVKHVERLTVKVFRINALNYFLSEGREADASIDLDGMIASDETTHTYDEPPLRRVRRTFKLPALAGSGTFVVELIGGGLSSRALIRKGRLRFVERTGAAGHVFTVMDEANTILPKASLWLSGREYPADEEGEIHLPYSTEPRRQRILLRHGEQTTLDAFVHRGEDYRFEAGLFVEREALLKRKQAEVAIRPRLTIHGHPVSMKLVEEPTLTIRAVDRQGTSSTRELPLELHDDREATHAFQVAEGLAQVVFTVRGKVKQVSTGAKIDLVAQQAYTLNTIDGTDSVQHLHLARTQAGYVLYLLGKTGEARAHTPLNVEVYHREFTFGLGTTLQTDARGRVELARLPGITRIEASTGDGASSEQWPLLADRCHHPSQIHAAVGEAIRIPYLGSRGAVDRDAFSLFEVRQGSYVHDRREALTLEDGYLVARGLQAGRYELRLKEHGKTIELLLAEGVMRAGWLASRHWLHERRYPNPLGISDVDSGEDGLSVRLSNATPRTRLHVFATRYLPAYDAFAGFGRITLAGPRSGKISRAPSAYQSGRDIGDEYRYVLERRQGEHFPGNMLTRPGLLLNPWSIRKTDTGTKSAADGGDYGTGAVGSARADSMGLEGEAPEAGSGGGLFANLDFLAHPAGVALNLRAGEDGVVRVPAELLRHANHVRLVAVDPLYTVVRDVVRPEVDAEHEDLSLRLALNPEGHFVERKEATPLRSGETLNVEDITTSKVEPYDSLSRVFQLYATLSESSDLQTFKFLLRWPSLTPPEKRSLYSEHACHELSFFVSRKDPEFFREVVQPYLRNKREKTFLDHYLLEEELSSYLEPWAHGRLNVVERILLAGRLDGQGGPTGRHVGDLFDLLVKDVDHENHLFRTALKGSSLETDDALGFGAAADAAKEAVMSRMMAMPASAPILGGGGPGGAAMAPPPRASRSRRSAAKSKKRMAEKPSAKMECADEDDEMYDMEECLAAPCEESIFSMALDDFFEGDELRQEKEVAKRDEVRQLFRKLEQTQELGENNYYHLTVDQQGPGLVTVNAFWRDFALHRGEGPFLSSHLAQASRCLTEMLFALAVLDLPFEAAKPEVSYDGATMRLAPKSHTVVFHEEIKPSEAPAEDVPILVSQNYFRKDDRYRYVDGEAVDKYVTDEFLVHVVYQCQVVLTNPTSSGQKLDLLMQIPRGALPVENGFFTKGMHLHLSSYGVQTFEYAFYFPRPGQMGHFPVHVSRNEELIASAAPRVLNVVEKLTKVDTTSWAWISQHGEPEQVLSYLHEHNVDRLELDKIAWRVRERGFYDQALPLLTKRHIYSDTLWAYSLYHRDTPEARQYLLHQESFLRSCGDLLEGPLVEIRAVTRGWYDHREYFPLVNARAHKLGAERKILNDRLRQQFERYTDMLCYRPRLSAEDWLEVAYYLFLQDRVQDGLEAFDRVDSGAVAERLQHDYLSCYVAFFRQDPDTARAIAQRHANHPVDRWRKLFDSVLAQLEEVEGKAKRVADEEDHAQLQGGLASSEPNLELAMGAGEVVLTYQNLTACTLNYYLMDVELLFSRQPFVQQQAGRFSWITPNLSLGLELPPGGSEHRVALPGELAGKNVVVEVVAGGLRRSQAHFAHDLRVQMVETYGQVRVGQRESGLPLAGAYVKVYSRDGRGQTKFFKDGYTDLRGRFDYASLSTSELDGVDAFGVLVLSEQAGAVIREARPPGR